VPDTATILMSAGVAAVTTSFIEFAVKPRLEVRKDRVLQQFRDREAVCKQLDTLFERLSRAGLESMIGAQTPQERVHTLSNELDVLDSQLFTLRQHCPKELLELVEWELVDSRTVVNTVGHMYRRGLKQDGAVSKETLEAATALLFTLLGQFGLTTNFLRLPRWRWVRRRKLLRAATRRLDFLKQGGLDQCVLDALFPAD